MTPRREVDTLVIGGGVVGMALAYGLARAGERVRLLDEGDDAYRAARGNFGLVWVQGKGFDRPAYARWTMAAAQSWPAFAAELAAHTGVDVELAQPVGLTLCLNDDELVERAAQLTRLRQQLSGAYPFEAWTAAQVKAVLPHSGPAVAGALWSPLDGHVSPLRLLRALVQGFASLGGELTAGVQVDQIQHRGGHFVVQASGQPHVAAKLVLAAGLGNRALAPLIGLRAPVQPNRGQILVSERVQPFLTHPTMQVRQTGDGVVQIGDSKEDVGLDDGTTLDQLSRIAQRATRCFPLLAQVNVVRSWGALRVMTADGYPIYQASSECPGGFVVTCHSGITLAAQHAGALVDWIRGGAEPAEIVGFKAERFDVPVH